METLMARRFRFQAGRRRARFHSSAPAYTASARPITAMPRTKRHKRKRLPLRRVGWFRIIANNDLLANPMINPTSVCALGGFHVRCGAQEAVGIYGSVVNADFVVQVRSGA